MKMMDNERSPSLHDEEVAETGEFLTSGSIARLATLILPEGHEAAVRIREWSGDGRFYDSTYRSVSLEAVQAVCDRLGITQLDGLDPTETHARMHTVMKKIHARGVIG